MKPEFGPFLGRVAITLLACTRECFFVSEIKYTPPRSSETRKQEQGRAKESQEDPDQSRFHE